MWGNEAAATGWLARAERLQTDVAPGAERGWLDLGLKTPRDVVVRRTYRRCVRNVSACSANRQHKSARFAGTLCKPSDGLEPSTPSL